MENRTMLAEQDSKVLDFAVRQFGLGYLTEREAVGQLREILRGASLQEVLPRLSDALAKALMDSLKVLGRFRPPYPPFPDEHWRALAYSEYLLVFSLLPGQRDGSE